MISSTRTYQHTFSPFNGVWQSSWSAARMHLPAYLFGGWQFHLVVAIHQVAGSSSGCYINRRVGHPKMVHHLSY
jgi:hypothetical protein